MHWGQQYLAVPCTSSQTPPEHRGSLCRHLPRLDGGSELGQCGCLVSVALPGGEVPCRNLEQQGRIHFSLRHRCDLLVSSCQERSLQTPCGRHVVPLVPWKLDLTLAVQVEDLVGCTEDKLGSMSQEPAWSVQALPQNGQSAMSFQDPDLAAEVLDEIREFLLVRFPWNYSTMRLDRPGACGKVHRVEGAVVGCHRVAFGPSFAALLRRRKTHRSGPFLLQRTSLPAAASIFPAVLVVALLVVAVLVVVVLVVVV